MFDDFLHCNWTVSQYLTLFLEIKGIPHILKVKIDIVNTIIKRIKI